MRLGLDAPRADDELEWCLHLCSERGPREELTTRDDRPHDLGDVTVCAQEGRGGALDECRRRVIAHQATRQLERDVSSSRRVARENIEHLLAVFDAAAGRGRVPENDLAAFVVAFCMESEDTRLAGPNDRPARECTGDLYDVALRVSTVDAERVELEQLARIVLVQRAASTREMLVDSGFA